MGIQPYNAKQTERRLAKIAAIRDLASKGYGAYQIASELGLHVKSVRKVSYTENIELADSVINKMRKLDVNRIIDQTIIGLNGCLGSPDLILDRLDKIDSGRIPEWTLALRILSRQLKSLIRTLENKGGFQNETDVNKSRSKEVTGSGVQGPARCTAENDESVTALPEATTESMGG